MRFGLVGRKCLLSGLKLERQHALVGGHSWGGTFAFPSRLCSSPPLSPWFVAFCTSASLCLGIRDSHAFGVGTVSYVG